MMARTYTPPTGDLLRYGQGPEQQMFSDSSAARTPVDQASSPNFDLGDISPTGVQGLGPLGSIGDFSPPGGLNAPITFGGSGPGPGGGGSLLNSGALSGAWGAIKEGAGAANDFVVDHPVMAGLIGSALGVPGAGALTGLYSFSGGLGGNDFGSGFGTEGGWNSGNLGGGDWGGSFSNWSNPGDWSGSGFSPSGITAMAAKGGAVRRNFEMGGLAQLVQQKGQEMGASPGEMQEAAQGLEQVFSTPGGPQELFTAAARNVMNHARGGRIEGGQTVCINRPGHSGYAQGGLASAAQQVAGSGTGQDSILVHMTKPEFDHLRATWGEPDVNPRTGMPEYNWLSDKWDDVKHGAKKIFQNKIFQTVAPIALDYFFPGAGRALGTWLGASGAAANVVGNAAIGAGMGAIADGKKGALSGAISGGIRGGGGALTGSALGLSGRTGNAVGTALLSGAGSKLQGGDFASGAIMGGIQGFLQPPQVPQAASLADSAAAAAVPQIDPNTGMEVEPSDLPGGPVNDLDAKIRAGSPRATMANPQPGTDWLGLAKKYALPVMGGLALASALSGKNQSTVGKPIPPQPGFNDPLRSPPFVRAPLGTNDYYTYGQTANPNPQEHQFFGDNAIPGLAQGGLLQSEHSPAVKGPGSGRDDHIPANLSDGEYVMDAETVALLGDGSGDEGARRLDEMRKNLRVHKAKGLSKGTHSPNAKRPEQYLDGEKFAKGGKIRDTTALFNKEGRIVHPGEKISDFRGEDWIITGHEAPRHSGSTGRVRVRPVDDDEESFEREFYPGVFGLEIRKPVLKKKGGPVKMAKGGSVMELMRPKTGSKFEVRKVTLYGTPSRTPTADPKGVSQFSREEAETHAAKLNESDPEESFQVFDVSDLSHWDTEEEIVEEMLKEMRKGGEE